MNETKSVGTRGEKSLHAALKHWYAQPGDQVECVVDGYRVDIVRGDLLIEIQTRNFGALRDKLARLLVDHPVRLVYPVPVDKWVARLDADGAFLGRRRSPKRGRVEDVFAELIRLPDLLAHPRFSLQVLLIRAEEQRRNDGLGSWRRKGWSIYDHILLDVVEPVTWSAPQDLLVLLPPLASGDPLVRAEESPDGAAVDFCPQDKQQAAHGHLPRPFTTTDLACSLAISRTLAQKMVYCLYHLDLLEKAGKRGRSILYRDKI